MNYNLCCRLFVSAAFFIRTGHPRTKNSNRVIKLISHLGGLYLFSIQLVGITPCRLVRLVCVIAESNPSHSKINKINVAVRFPSFEQITVTSSSR